MGKKSSTILFVSHSLDYVQDLCDRSIWLNKGQVAFAGDTEEAIKRYLDYVGIKEYIAPPIN